MERRAEPRESSEGTVGVSVQSSLYRTSIRRQLSRIANRERATWPAPPRRTEGICEAQAGSSRTVEGRRDSVLIPLKRRKSPTYVDERLELGAEVYTVEADFADEGGLLVRRG
jgi:hypothetical protein